MTSPINRSLAIDLAPELAIQATARYLEESGYERVDIRPYRRVFPLFAKKLLEIPRDQWTTELGIQITGGLGAVGASVEARTVASVLAASLATLIELIEGGHTLPLERVVRIANGIGPRFGLTEIGAGSLGRVIAGLANALSAEYLICMNTEHGRSESGVALSQVEAVRKARRTYDLFFDEPERKVYVRGELVSVSPDSYPYDILAMLSKRVGEVVASKEIEKTILTFYENSAFTADRVANEVNRLRSRGLLPKEWIAGVPRGGYVLSRSVKSCLILRWDSKFLLARP